MTTIISCGSLVLEKVDSDSALDEVRAVLDDAALRLARAGIDQWPTSFLDDGGKRMVALRQHAQRGEVHLLRWHGQPVATMTITDWADPDFAEHWPTPVGTALYVMRFARTAQANELTPENSLRPASTLLDYAGEMAWRAGRNFLRLDCSRTNTALHRYYGNRGFTHVKTVDVSGRKSGALFQKTVVR